MSSRDRDDRTQAERDAFTIDHLRKLARDLEAQARGWRDKCDQMEWALSADKRELLYEIQSLRLTIGSQAASIENLAKEVQQYRERYGVVAGEPPKGWASSTPEREQ